MNIIKKIYNKGMALAYNKQIPHSDRVGPEQLLLIQEWMMRKGICVDGKHFFTPQKKSVVKIVDSCENPGSIRPLTRAERRYFKFKNYNNDIDFISNNDSVFAWLHFKNK